jgi:hypothetical protein
MLYIVLNLSLSLFINIVACNHNTTLVCGQPSAVDSENSQAHVLNGN